MKCKNCGEEIAKKGREWRHAKTGFWKCLDRHAEPRAAK